MHHLLPLVASWVLALAGRSQPASELLGRWAGESVCVGARPTCHLEHVVYRIDSTGVGAVTMQGARVAGADTVDMGPLACRVAVARTSGRSEATCRIAVGVWRFWVAQGRLEGALRLADSTLERHVVAHRLTHR